MSLQISLRWRVANIRHCPKEVYWLSETKSYRTPSSISFPIEEAAPQKKHLNLENKTSGRYTYIVVLIHTPLNDTQN